MIVGPSIGLLPLGRFYDLEASRTAMTMNNDMPTTWTTKYQLVFVSGTQMTNQSAVNLPYNVMPGRHAGSNGGYQCSDDCSCRRRHL